MVNATLFASGIVMAMIHMIGFALYGVPSDVLSASMGFGLITTIWNHGTTSRSAIFIDRAMMWIGTCINILIIYENKLWIEGTMLYSAILFYALAKLYDVDNYHWIAHGLLTYVHMRFVYLRI